MALTSAEETNGAGSKRTPTKDMVKVGPRYFQIRGTLGKGGFSVVYAGSDSDTGKKVALKMMFDVTPDAEDATYKQTCDEIKMMRKLQHRNLIKLLGYDLHATYLNRPCVILVQEIAPNRELFEYLLHSQSTFSEPLVVYIMKNVFKAIQFMHDKGVAHRDLKPENILLDKEFTVKIADFGFAKFFYKHDQRMKMRTELGTRGYMAPEISENAKKAASRANRKSYDEKVDTFALGVILFICSSGFPPFRQTNSEDWWFDKIIKGQWEYFWKAHERKHTFSDGVKDLLEQMLCYDASSRLTVEECLAHDFITGTRPELSKEEYIQEMKKRYSVVKQKLRTINANKAETNRDVVMPIEESPEILDNVLVDGDYVPAKVLCMNDMRKEIFEAPEEEVVKLMSTKIVDVSFPNESAQNIFAIMQDVMKVYSDMSEEDVATVRDAFCNSTSVEALEGCLPEGFSTKVFFTQLNTNLLGTEATTEVSMSTLSQYEEFDECELLLLDPAELEENEDEGYKSMLFNVKYGFGTLVHFMKDLHSKTPSVTIDPATGSATVSYLVEDKMVLDDEEVDVSEIVEIHLQMFAFDTESETEAPKGFALKAGPNGYLQTHLNAFEQCWELLLQESNFLHPLFLN